MLFRSLKGIHLAIKSGMLAAETAYEAMAKDDFSLDVLEKFQDRVEKSWIKDELWPVRNFHQGFESGQEGGMRCNNGRTEVKIPRQGEAILRPVRTGRPLFPPP